MQPLNRYKRDVRRLSRLGRPRRFAGTTARPFSARRMRRRRQALTRTWPSWLAPWRFVDADEPESGDPAPAVASTDPPPTGPLAWMMWALALATAIALGLALKACTVVTVATTVEAPGVVEPAASRAQARGGVRDDGGPPDG